MTKRKNGPGKSEPAPRPVPGGDPGLPAETPVPPSGGDHPGRSPAEAPVRDPMLRIDDGPKTRRVVWPEDEDRRLRDDERRPEDVIP